jgi:hypothetical protein
MSNNAEPLFDLDDLDTLMEYYSELSGKNLSYGVTGDGEFWVNTGILEYYDNLQDVDKRLHSLYAHLLLDDGDDYYEDVI